MNTNNLSKASLPRKKGVRRQFSGAVFLSLGALNLMLSLKAGLQFDMFNAVLLTAGSVLMLSGVAASRNRRT